jgi:hypothetical protein
LRSLAALLAAPHFEESPREGRIQSKEKLEELAGKRPDDKDARGGVMYELRDPLKNQEKLCAKETREGNKSK